MQRQVLRALLLFLIANFPLGACSSDPSLSAKANHRIGVDPSQDSANDIVATQPTPVAGSPAGGPNPVAPGPGPVPVSPSPISPSPISPGPMPAPPAPTPTITCNHYDWLGTVNGGLPNSVVSDIVLANGRLYVASVNGLSVSDDATGAHFVNHSACGGELGENDIMGMAVATSGVYFYVYSQGVYKLYAADANVANPKQLALPGGSSVSAGILKIRIDGPNLLVLQNQQLWVSHDLGLTWTMTLAGPLYNFWTAGDGLTVAVGNDVRTSVDGGITFQVLPAAQAFVGQVTNPASQWSAVAAGTHALYFITEDASNNFSLMQSLDLGATFHPVTVNPTGCNLERVAANGSDVYVSGSCPITAASPTIDYFVSASHDGGKSFARLDATKLWSNTTDLSIFATGGDAMVAGNGIFLSADHGASFSPLLAPNPASANAVGSLLAPTASTLLLSSFATGVFLTDSLGMNPSSVLPTSAYLLQDGNRILATTGNTPTALMSSVDGGKTFSTLNATGILKIYVPVAVSQGRIYGFDKNSSPIVSADGGATFAPLAIPATTASFQPNKVLGLTDRVILIIEGLAYSNAGTGTTFSELNIGTYADRAVADGSAIILQQMRVVPPATLASYSAVISSDGGATFAPFALNPQFGISSLAVSGSYMALGTFGGGVYFSTDAGKTFQQNLEEDGLRDELIFDLKILGNRLFVATHKGVVARTLP